MADAQTGSDSALPLAGIRVLEFCHAIMGPSAGLILADLGADVIKIEPVAGDTTRRLVGFAAGFFATFNRSTAWTNSRWFVRSGLSYHHHNLSNIVDFLGGSAEGKLAV
jgi:hypothetical protein